MSTGSPAVKLGKDELTREASRFLDETLRRARLDLQFECSARENAIHVQLRGADADLLLSNNGRVLYAINHLLNQAFYRRSSEGCSFLVDCDGYRDSRSLELEALSRSAADRVKHSGKPLSLQPMPASERRVIHLTLAENPAVRTESEGTGLHRRVVILPAG